MKEIHKYEEIWEANLPKILECIEKGGSSDALCQKSVFVEKGERKASGHTFRLDINDGEVPEKSGSAVARDLKRVLDSSLEFKRISKGKKIVIRLGKYDQDYYRLEIQVS